LGERILGGRGEKEKRSSTIGPNKEEKSKNSPESKKGNGVAGGLIKKRVSSGEDNRKKATHV